MAKKKKLLKFEKPIQNVGMKFEEAIKQENDEYRTWVYHQTEEPKIVNAKTAQELMDLDEGWTIDPIKVSPDSIKDNLQSQMIVGMTGRFANQLLMLDKVESKEELIELQYTLFGKKSPSNINIDTLKDNIRDLAAEKGIPYDNNSTGSNK